MKIHKMSEFSVVKIRREQITDLYEARMAIYRAAKAIKDKTGAYPTIVALPSNGEERLGYLREFVVRHGAKLLTEFYVPYGEIWVGFQRGSSRPVNFPDWARKPSMRPEEIRHIHHPRARSVVIRKGRMSEVNPSLVESS